MDIGKHREIIMRRRRQGQPLERAAVPRVAGDVAPLVARLDRIESWTTVSTIPRPMIDRADKRDVQPGRPGGSGMCCIRRVAPQKPST